MVLRLVFCTALLCASFVHGTEKMVQSFNCDGELVLTGGGPFVSSYRIEQCSSLRDSWQLLTNCVPQGDGIVTNLLPMDSSSGFFKIEPVTLPPPEGMVGIATGINSGSEPEFRGYSVTIETIYMDATEITKAKWDSVYQWATSNGYQFDNSGQSKAPGHPVQTVNWYDCVKWCNARSEMDGRTPCYTVDGAVYKTGQVLPECDVDVNGYRLPTANEFEYVSRGGTKSTRYYWGNTINHSNANYCANSTRESYDVSPYTSDTYHPTYNAGEEPYTSPVGSFPPNGFGLYDTSGNVSEWTNNQHWDAPNEIRVVGGSWLIYAKHARCGSSQMLPEGGTLWTYAHSAHNSRGFRTLCLFSP